MLNLAIANLRQYFVFVGIVEQLAQSFDRLCTVMDWDRSLFPDELPNDPLQEEVNDFSEDEKLLVINLIKFDLRLYSEALKIVSEDLAQNKI